MKTSIIVVIVVLLMTLSFCPSAEGALPHIKVASITEASGVAPDSTQPWERLIDDSGMSGDTHTLADTSSNYSWPDYSVNGMSNNHPSIDLTFDLGADYQLDEIWIWNYNMDTARWAGGTTLGQHYVQIYYEADGGSPISGGYHTILQADGTTTNAVDLIVDLGGVTARYVNFYSPGHPDLNYTGGVYNSVGLGEVRFYTNQGIATCGQAIGQGYGLSADINKDCHVDLNDIAELSHAWLTCMDPETDDPNACLHPWEP